MRSKRLRIGLGLGLSVLLVAAGCGGNGGEKKGGGAAAITEKAESKVSDLYESTYHEPPGDAPPPAKNKKLWVISAGQEIESAKNASENFAEAAGLLGWDVKIFDGQFDPTKWLAGVRDAILDEADGIWLYSFDCSPVRAAVQEAKRAGIPVVVTAGADCKPSLVDHVTGYSEGTFTDWNFAFGESPAWWLIAKTDGQAKVIEFIETDLRTLIEIARGFERVIEKCASCEIVDTVEFVGADYGPKLQQKAEQALLQNPDANAVFGSFDSPITAGIGAAVRASGRDLLVTGGEGLIANVGLVYEGVQDVGIGYDNRWEGWNGVDAFVRIFAGEDPIQDTGFGIQLYDRETNLPPEGESYQAPSDFMEAYKRSWGVE